MTISTRLVDELNLVVMATLILGMGRVFGTIAPGSASFKNVHSHNTQKSTISNIVPESVERRDLGRAGRGFENWDQAQAWESELTQRIITRKRV